MEHKICTQAEVKISTEGTGTISGYLSTFSNWDKLRPIPERPTKGAFARHIPEILRDGFFSLSHDWAKLPIATFKELYEDDTGLYFVAEYHGTPEAQQARQTAAERLARQKSVKTSIGFDILADEFVEIDDPALLAEGVTTGRLLKDIYVYEGSQVNVPANPLAAVASVKDILAAGGLSFADKVDAVVSAASGVVSTAQSHHAARTKEGRVLSTANRNKLTTLHTSLQDVMQAIEELLAASEPRDEEAAKDFLREIIRTTQINARYREMMRN